MVTGEQNGDKEAAVKGDLSEAPFARVFYGFCREKRSGTLDVRDKPAEEGGKPYKRVVMVEGNQFAVSGGSKKETLPELLVARGKLTPEQYETLKQDTKGDYGKMEDIIKSGVMVPAAELPELLTFQVEVKIKMLFSVFGGYYEFKPQARETLTQKHVVMPVSPEKLLLEGVTERFHEDRIKKEFAGIEKKTFSRAETFKDRLMAFGLAPNLLRWLRLFPETFTWAAATRGAPLNEEQAFPILLGFYFAGLITLPENEEDFPLGKAYLAAEAKGAKKKPVKMEKAPEAAKPAAAPQAPAAPPPEPKLPIEEMLDKAMSDQELLTELDRLLDVVESAKTNYFEMLGLPETVPQNKIKSVYFKFAKKFHPDARPDLFVGEVKTKVEDLFTKISEAYNTLGDNESRVAYQNQLKTRVSDADMDKGYRAVQAEMEFNKAEVMMKKGLWAEAAEMLERAVKLYADEPEYLMYQAWVNYKIKGQSEAGRAKTVIRKVLEERPSSAEANVFLGHFAKEDGMFSEAEKHYEQALKLKPHDVDIKRELQILYRRKDKTPSEKKGGLFGKKK